jgi:uncharacterized radical SAM superfamily Fe-S cluster-containing enzyme
VALSVLRNLRPENLPKGLGALSLIKIMDGHTGGKLGIAKKKRYSWRVLFIGGMWFQDLFNYDFRRTEMCIIPYATQMGEISFCAYNTGVGWRKIVEEIFRSATTAEWYKTRGRHAVYARGKSVPLPTLPDSPAPVVPITAPAHGPSTIAAKAMLPVFSALVK